MSKMYFENKQHEVNYKQTLLIWNIAKTNTEYEATCYILSLPMISEKVKDYIGEFENPTSWIYLWEWLHTLSKSEEFQDFDNRQKLMRTRLKKKL